MSDSDFLAKIRSRRWHCLMNSIDVALPGTLKNFVDDQVSAQG